MMTRKHFRIIAKALASMDVTGEQCDIMCHALSKTNERFSPSKFKNEVARLKAYYLLNNLDENSPEFPLTDVEHNNAISTLGDNIPEWYAGPNM